MRRNAIEKARDTLGTLQGLSHVVQCNQGHYWETIAAFNVGKVARQYAADNRRAAKAQGFTFRYRVRAL